MRSRAAALIGSGLFLLLAPGTVARYLPWLIGRWRFDNDLGNSALIAASGGLLIALGGLCLLECFFRFAWQGLGTPAPVAQTDRLIVTGLYRHVRNPMYVSVIALVLGQALLFGQAELLPYAAAVWAMFHLFVRRYEEPTLRRRYGAEYECFARAVPRWLPRARPWNPGR